MKRQLPVFTAILLLALGLRLGMLLKRPHDLSTDPDGYVAHAQMLSAGKGFVGPFSGAPTAFRPPGYPWLLSLGLRESADPVPLVGMVNMAAGLLTVLLTRQLAENIGLTPLAAQLAAVFVAADPLLVRYTALPMTEVVSACVLTAALMLLVWFSRKSVVTESRQAADSESPEAGWLAGLTGGALLGAAALIRPVSLVVCALVTGYFVVLAVRSRCRSGDRGSLAAGRKGWTGRRMKSGLLVAMLPALAFACVLSPWVARNWRVFSEIIPATTHGGYTLALGNNPDYYRDVVRGDWNQPWDGNRLDAWQKEMRMLAAEQGVLAGDEVATDQFLYEQAHRAIRAHPMDFVRACGLRTLMFWRLAPTASRSPTASDALPGSGEPAVSSASTASRQAAPAAAAAATESLPSLVIVACRLWYGAIWLLVIFSVVLFRSSPRKLSVACLWLTVAAFQLIHMVYWTDTRMRAPIMPVLAVLAAVGFEYLMERVQAARRGTLQIPPPGAR